MIKNILVITLSLLFLLTNNYLGHVNPPFSILFTPVLIGVFTGLILFFTDFRIAAKFGLITGLVIVNDVFIRIYAGGTHDLEGLGWIAAFLFIGLIVSLIEIVVYGFIKHKHEKVKYFLLLLAFCVILFSYLSYFNSLGMIYLNNPIEDLGESKKKGLFISEISFSKDSLIIDNDTLVFKYGWIEKQTRLNHHGLFKKTEETGKMNFIIGLKGKFDKYGYNDSIYFKVNDSDSNGASPINKVLSFTIEKQMNDLSIYFFKQGDWTKFKEIKIITAINK